MDSGDKYDKILSKYIQATKGLNMISESPEEVINPNWLSNETEETLRIPRDPSDTLEELISSSRAATIRLNRKKVNPTRGQHDPPDLTSSLRATVSSLKKYTDSIEKRSVLKYVAPTKGPTSPRSSRVESDFLRALRDDKNTIRSMNDISTRDTTNPITYNSKEKLEARLEVLNAKSRAFKDFLAQSRAMKYAPPVNAETMSPRKEISPDDINSRMKLIEAKNFVYESSSSGKETKQTKSQNKYDASFSNRVSSIRGSTPAFMNELVQIAKESSKNDMFSVNDLHKRRVTATSSVIDDKAVTTGNKIAVTPSFSTASLTNATLHKPLAMKILSEKILIGYRMGRANCEKCTMTLLTSQNQTSCVVCPMLELRSVFRNNVARRVLAARVLQGYNLGHGRFCELCFSPRMTKNNEVKCEVCPILDAACIKVVQEESKGGKLQEKECFECGSMTMKNEMTREYCIICSILKEEIGETIICKTPEMEASHHETTLKSKDHSFSSSGIGSWGSPHKNSFNEGVLYLDSRSLNDLKENTTAKLTSFETDRVLSPTPSYQWQNKTVQNLQAEMDEAKIAQTELELKLIQSLTSPCCFDDTKNEGSQSRINGTLNKVDTKEKGINVGTKEPDSLASMRNTLSLIGSKEKLNDTLAGVVSASTEMLAEDESLLKRTKDICPSVNSNETNICKSENEIVASAGSKDTRTIEEQLRAELEKARNSQAALEEKIAEFSRAEKLRQSSPTAQAQELSFVAQTKPKGFPDIAVKPEEAPSPEGIRSFSISQREVESGILKEYNSPKASFENGIPMIIEIIHPAPESVAQSFHTNLRETIHDKKQYGGQFIDCLGMTGMENNGNGLEGYDDDTIETNDFTVDYTLNTIDSISKNKVRFANEINEITVIDRSPTSLEQFWQCLGCAGNQEDDNPLNTTEKCQVTQLHKEQRSSEVQRQRRTSSLGGGRQLYTTYHSNPPGFQTYSNGQEKPHGIILSRKTDGRQKYYNEDSHLSPELMGNFSIDAEYSAEDAAALKANEREVIVTNDESKTSSYHDNSPYHEANPNHDKYGISPFGTMPVQVESDLTEQKDKMARHVDTFYINNQSF